MRGSSEGWSDEGGQVYFRVVPYMNKLGLGPVSKLYSEILVSINPLREF